MGAVPVLGGIWEVAFHGVGVYLVSNAGPSLSARRRSGGRLGVPG
jgi:hypothetical protein